MATVRPAYPEDLPVILDIVRALPDHFTPDVPGAAQHDFARHTSWVVCGEGGEVVGFTVADRRSSRAAEILWSAVHPARRRHGLGRLMIDGVLEALARDGVRLVEAKTLDRSAGEAGTALCPAAPQATLDDSATAPSRRVDVIRTPPSRFAPPSRAAIMCPLKCENAARRDNPGPADTPGAASGKHVEFS